MLKRPLPLTLLACLYIVTGLVGFAYHLSDLNVGGGFHWAHFWIEVMRLIAVVAGAFLLRGLNWARWLALAWIGFHVGISFFHTVPELAMHCLIFVVIAWILFRPQSALYFRARTAHPTL